MAVKFKNGLIVEEFARAGIGTLTPDKTLHVLSPDQCPALFESTTAGGGIALMDSTTTNDSQVGIGAFGDHLCFRSGGAAAGNMRLLSNGNFLIGSTSELTGGGRLQVNGTVNVSTINNGTGDFVTWDGNVLTRRTAAQVKTDIGVVDYEWILKDDPADAGASVISGDGVVFRGTNGITTTRGTGAGGKEIIIDGSGTPSGTVTSITAGDGLSGGAITTSGTIAVDSTVVRTSGNQTIGGAKTFSSTIVGSINGNAATATTWQTARTLTIGNTGKTFNGGADVSWSLAEIGAQAALTNPVTGTGANGRVAFWNGTTTQSSDAGLFWDNTFKRLGIGTTSPTRQQTIYGVTSSFVQFINPTTGTSANSGVLFGISTAGEGVIRHHENEAIRIDTNNIERVRITNTGDVGIGTTSPSSKLEIRSEIATHQLISINRAASNIAALYIGNDNNNDGVIAVNNGELRIGKDISGNFTEYFRINPSGNVGIGTTNPQAKLQTTGHIVGGIPDSNTPVSATTLSGFTGLGSFNSSLLAENIDALYLRKGTTDGGSIGISFGAAGGDSYFVGARIKHIRAGSNSNGHLVFETKNDSSINTTAERLRITSTGNVGIGNNSPASKLEVTGNVAIGYTNAAPANGLIVSGDVGIGTNSPSSKLHVQGGDIQLNGVGTYPELILRASSLTGNNIRFKQLPTGLEFSNSQSNRGFSFVQGTTTSMIIDSSGNVGIGNTTPASKLEVTGNVAVGYTSAAPANGMIVSGDVGIGITSPPRRLTVSRLDTVNLNTVTNANQSVIRLNNPTSTIGAYTGIQFGFNTLAQDGQVHASIGVIQDSTSSTWGGRLAFANKADTSNGVLTEYMSIITGGNVGIGNTSPASKLEVTGNVAIGYTNAAPTNGLIVAGDVGIGTDSPTRDFQIGNLTSTSTATPKTLSLGGTFSNSAGNNVKLRVYDDLGTAVGGMSVSSGQMEVNTWSSGKIAFYRGTTQTMIIDASGNVGIGNTSPASKLEVTGNVAIGYTSAAPANGMIVAGRVGIGTTSPSSKLEIRSEIATHQLISINRAASNTAALYIGNDNNNDGVIAVNNGELRIGKDISGNFTEYFRINPSGNVGIGNDTPASKLEVTGNVAIGYTNAAPANGMIVAGDVGIGTSSPVGKLSVSVDESAISTVSYLVNENRTDGVSQGLQQTYRLRGGTLTTDRNAGYLRIGVDTANGGNYAVNGGRKSYMAFATAGGDTDAERMRITSGGNLLVGTTSDNGAKLQVSGALRTTDDITITKASDASFIADNTSASGKSYRLVSKDDGRFYIQNTGIADLFNIASTGAATFSSSVTATSFIKTGGTSTQYLMADGSVSTLTNPITGTGTTNFLSKFTGGTTLGNSLVFDNGTSVGIGTTTPSYPLEVSGNASGTSIYASHDIVAYSDISVKGNIRPIENPLERVSKSRGVVYDRTDTDTKDNIGFIAQELEQQFPELVVTNPDGTKAVKYQNATAVLFEAVKELKQKIESQEERLSKLEQLITKNK